MSQELKKAIIKIVPYEQCFPYYGDSLDFNTMICAAYGKGSNTCGGDSGGPLVYNNVIVGVVSTGTGECDKGYPEVYAKVLNFLQYIQYEMGGLGSEYSYISNAIDVDQTRSMYG
ncbi:hypothetical protein QAD02_019848 [Eretmocerus hayati]|uniref:Uncharacterized protein n=1 Tax=Eretmocerus hayati TaxID=131215 RepID=A0ACC2PML2_9HYME|nr:hypothetical protein QAD02_019848 [Eretmocerus hayati]